MIPGSDTFSSIPIPDFVDIIIEGGERGDEAMYYLLHERLERQLKGRYEKYRHQLLDDFEDVVEDFFLYLRDGNFHPSNHLGQGDNGWSNVTYPSLRHIRKKESFES